MDAKSNDPSVPEDEDLLHASRFRVVRRYRRLPSGTVVAREIVEHPGAVTILPLVDDSHVCLIRNYRVAVGRALLELPAGTLEHGEDPTLCAERELVEETGYRAGRIERACEFFMSPGILNERMHLFVARDLVLGETELEEGEEIERAVVAWDEAMRLVRTGEVQDAKSLVGLLWHDGLLKGRSP
ncbi:MAG: NUDIX hydrolase [Planctomycetota bacterium]|nr:MAG: NUDIX hydrolase [Planctomycetota bacterium]